jgi:hypothetical protein
LGSEVRSCSSWFSPACPNSLSILERPLAKKSSQGLFSPLDAYLSCLRENKIYHLKNMCKEINPVSLEMPDRFGTSIIMHVYHKLHKLILGKPNELILMQKPVPAQITRQLVLYGAISLQLAEVYLMTN